MIPDLESCVCPEAMEPQRPSLMTANSTISLRARGGVGTRRQSRHPAPAGYRVRYRRWRFRCPSLCRFSDKHRFIRALRDLKFREKGRTCRYRSLALRCFPQRLVCRRSARRVGRYLPSPDIHPHEHHVLSSKCRARQSDECNDVRPDPAKNFIQTRLCLRRPLGEGVGVVIHCHGNLWVGDGHCSLLIINSRREKTDHRRRSGPPPPV